MTPASLPVDLAELEASLGAAEPPAALGRALRALWLEARGDWAAAHELVNEEEGPEDAWVHAYLHRKEGDESNAGYWYSVAGRPPGKGPFEREWRAIARALLAAPRETWGR